ncbi:hypothetical protein [Candidatus Magnetomonas plexicatena]|uniref:hypothetical protein n=1 Tax=Candidatus Magnetomonas plexicatena TaxID=2552947 RepID=UPI001104805E|nr:hypothetical protein E2O03_012265 [Nitrospirales bacterium LBB_01]
MTRFLIIWLCGFFITMTSCSKGGGSAASSVNFDNRSTEVKAASDNATAHSIPFEIRKDAQLTAIPPQKKLTHLKVRKDAKGSYTWELSGDDIREIIKLDREMRKAFPEAMIKGGKDGKLFDKRSAGDGSED